MTFNPNEYDEHAYIAASNNLAAAIAGYYFAGATLENLEDDLSAFIQASGFGNDA